LAVQSPCFPSDNQKPRIFSRWFNVDADSHAKSIIMMPASLLSQHVTPALFGLDQIPPGMHWTYTNPWEKRFSSFISTSFSLGNTANCCMFSDEEQSLQENPHWLSILSVLSWQSKALRLKPCEHFISYTNMHSGLILNIISRTK